MYHPEISKPFEIQAGLHLNTVGRMDMIHRSVEQLVAPGGALQEAEPGTRMVRLLGGDAEIARMKETKLTAEKIVYVKQELVSGFVAVASDLGTLGLAQGHVERLIHHIVEYGAQNELELATAGAVEFYKVARHTLGPLWAGYVHEILSTGQGGESYLFAARDATPMKWAAEGLIAGAKERYHLGGATLVHVDWNRWFMGQEDETEDGTKPLSLQHPLMNAFYDQMGFGKGKKVKIVEPGAWGSAANALRKMMPEQDFELFFMFSHMPEYIYGFINEHAPQATEQQMEMINDTAEATPKAYTRPTNLVHQNGIVVADTKDHILPSKMFQLWTWAVNEGALAAGFDHAGGYTPDIAHHVQHIISLSADAAAGKWTGVLPRNTLTWSEGDNWRASWPWGKIPPLY